MQWNIKNAEEQKQRPQSIMNNRPSILRSDSISQVQLNLQTFKRYKTQYVALLLLLVQILLTVVLFVLFMTLNYIGFGKVNDSFISEKIFFDDQICKDPYLNEVRKFIPIKIKTAFIYLAFQLILAFVNILLGFFWIMNVIKNQRRKYFQGNKLSELRKESRILNILITCCILLVILIFGTYLQFTVIHGKTKQSSQCKLEIFSKQIFPIATLMGIKLGIYLVIWLILMFLTTSINKIFEDQKIQSKVKLPEIDQLHSIYVEDQNRMVRQNDNSEGKNKHASIKGQNIEEDNIFKQLKSEDFLLQLKDNEIVKKIFEPQSNNNLQAEQQNNMLSNPLRLLDQEDYQQSNRRMMVYQPLDSQKYASDKRFLTQENEQKQYEKIVMNIKDFGHSILKKSSVEEFIVNNSVEKDNETNNNHGQLLIESISKPSIDKLITHHISSKRVSFNDLQSNNNDQGLKVRFSKKQYPQEDDTIKEVKLNSQVNLDQQNLQDVVISELKKMGSQEYKRQPRTNIIDRSRPPKLKSKQKVPKVEIQEGMTSPQEQLKQVKSIIMGLDSLNDPHKPA